MPLDMISQIHLGKQKICKICEDQMCFHNAVRCKGKFCSSGHCGDRGNYGAVNILRYLRFS